MTPSSRCRGSSNRTCRRSAAASRPPGKPVNSAEPDRNLSMRQFLFPDLGEGLEEAEIVGWHVNEGDHVVVDQPLVSLETDKAVVEVPCPQTGRIAPLFGGTRALATVVAL